LTRYVLYIILGHRQFNMTTETSTMEQPEVVETNNNKINTPKLRCIITGKERLTNRAYLTQKAEATEGNIEKFLSLYISRPALKHLRKGKTVDETRFALCSKCVDPIGAELLDEALKLNGKWSK